MNNLLTSSISIQNKNCKSNIILENIQDIDKRSFNYYNKYILQNKS